MTNAEITGDISLSDDKVEATGVTYTFNLRSSDVIPADGKLVVRFPENFEEVFSVTGCSATSGFSTTGALTCDYLQNVRLLEITDGFPTTFTEITFTVEGVTNPNYAGETSEFELTAYEQIGNDFFVTERSGSSIQPVVAEIAAGALTNESFQLADSTVGAYSTLTIGLTTEHVIPMTGSIEIDFPKWNPFATLASQVQSYVATSTSPGEVACDALSNIPVSGTSTNLDCVLTHGTDTDTLSVSFSGLLSSDIAAGSQISFSVESVRGPPTTSAVTGFDFRTLNDSGLVIDRSSDPSSLTLKVNSPAATQGTNMEVTADDPSINAVSTLQLKLRITNPLEQDSNIQITIPTDFDMTTLDTVSSPSSFLYSTLTYTVDQATRTVVVTGFNKVYLSSLELVYFDLSLVTNPSQTGPTGTFTYKLFDPSNNIVEESTTDIQFTATAGGFGTISLSTDKTKINEDLVKYTFTMRPQDTFTSDAIIKITCPTQVFLDSDANVSGGTGGLIDTATANTDVKFNRIIYIYDAFPNGMTEVQTFDIEINGFTNPPTTQPTDSFKVKIFYEEDTNEVSNYSGTALTFTATPSTALEIAATMTELQTGEIQSEFIITGTIERDNPIEKQAYLRVQIPKDFIITDPDRIASTCTRLTGFSDELSCSFEERSSNLSPNYLIVAGGFDSKTFTDTSFSLSISEIQNPLTTKVTDDFKMEIYDRLGGLMYTSANDFNLQVGPSDFAFAFVESDDRTNGVDTATYTVTITLGVDTSQSAQLKMTPPSGIKFVDPILCKGTQTLLMDNNICEFQTGDGSRIISLNADARYDLGSGALKSGTTIQFDISNVQNPMSLKSSDYFYFETYDTTTGDVYNQSMNQVRITNTESGPITLESVIQGSTELGAETSLTYTFVTQSAIPSSATISFTLPPNVEIGDNPVMQINDNVVQPVVNKDAKQFTLDGLPVNNANNFVIAFSSGIYNPTTGPYDYSYSQIEFEDTFGYSIDKITLNESFLSNLCTDNCDTCSGSLSTCTGCSYDAAQEKSFYLQDQSCVEECNPGFFKDSGYQCSACESPCLECDITATSCLICDPTSSEPFANLAQLKCYAECPDGTYLDTETTQCKTCVSPCYTCSDATTCLSCDRTDPANLAVYFFSSDSQCYEECPNISVPTASKKCDACVAPCETCETLTSQCLTCVDGYYLHTNYECVESCPAFYYEDAETRTCTYFGELALPVPFSIIAFVCTVGVGISSFVKGADKEGREQEGTAFFILMLALVDIILRFNWAFMAYSVYNKEFYVTFGWIIGLLTVTLFFNFCLWRRMFYSKYKYEDLDPLFSTYTHKYPATANIMIFLSYLITFQAIRITYSRLLGKKKFMARFTRRRRFYRLIGRLTVMEILFIYLPALAMNIYSFTNSNEQQDMTYWFNIDSLILISYALILIFVVLTQREKLVNSKVYFSWGELLNFGDDADEDEVHLSPEKLQSHKDVGGSLVERADDAIEVHSAFGHDDILKPKMYQLEQRYKTQLSDGQAGAHKRNSSQMTGGRAVSVIDYQEYRKLEDKRDRIMLKKGLYERKKGVDEAQVVLLNEELNQYQQTKKELADQMEALKKQLRMLQKDIVTVDKTRKKELNKVEQEKRRDIIRRAGREVPYQSHSGVTSQSRSRSQLTKSNNTQVSKSPRDLPNQGQTKKRRGQRGNQRAQQAKSPRMNMQSVPVNQTESEITRTRQAVNENLTTMQADPNESSMILQQSPNIFQSNLIINEPLTNPNGEQVRPMGLPGNQELQVAIDLQMAMEQQMSTEKAESLRTPALDRPDGDETTVHAEKYPALKRASGDGDATTVQADNYPVLNRGNGDGEQTTVQADNYPALNRGNGSGENNATYSDNINIAVNDIRSTEPADNLQRPINTLQTEQVVERLEDATMMGGYPSGGEPGARDSFGAPQLNQTGEEKKEAGGDNDDVW